MTLRDKVKWLDTHRPEARRAQMDADELLGNAANHILEPYRRDGGAFSKYSEPTGADRAILETLEHARRFLLRELLASVPEDGVK